MSNAVTANKLFGAWLALCGSQMYSSTDDPSLNIPLVQANEKLFNMVHPNSFHRGHSSELVIQFRDQLLEQIGDEEDMARVIGLLHTRTEKMAKFDSSMQDLADNPEVRDQRFLVRRPRTTVKGVVKNWWWLRLADDGRGIVWGSSKDDEETDSTQAEFNTIEEAKASYMEYVDEVSVDETADDHDLAAEIVDENDVAVVVYDAMDDIDGYEWFNANGVY